MYCKRQIVVLTPVKLPQKALTEMLDEIFGTSSLRKEPDVREVAGEASEQFHVMDITVQHNWLCFDSHSYLLISYFSKRPTQILTQYGQVLFPQQLKILLSCCLTY